MVQAGGVVVSIAVDCCKGCGLCLIFCPVGIIRLEKDRLNVKGYHPASLCDTEECIGCGNCAQMCPDYAITIDRVEP